MVNFQEYGVPVTVYRRAARRIPGTTPVISPDTVIPGYPGSLNAMIVANTIPSQLTASQSYNVLVTVRNTCDVAWSEDGITPLIRFSSVGGTVEEIYLFGDSRSKIPSGTTVNPGEEYTFSFTVTAPAAGDYTHSWMMTQDAGYGPFGDTLSKNLHVADGDPLVNCAGDSITVGQTEVVNNYLYEPTYMYWLAKRLPGASFNNFGVGDDTSAGGLARINTILANNPDYVINLWGTNDIAYGVSLATIEDTLTAIYSAERTNGAVPVHVTLLPRTPFTPEQKSVLLSLNEWITADAATHTEPLIDWYIVMDDPSNPGNITPSLTIDGIHPNIAGYQAMAAAADIGIFRNVNLDAYGNPIYKPINIGSFPGIMSSVAPMEVDGLDGKTETTTMLLIAPLDAGVEMGDELEVDGHRYAPLGSPESWRRYQRQTVHHLEIPLRRT